VVAQPEDQSDCSARSCPLSALSVGMTTVAVVARVSTNEFTDVCHRAITGTHRQFIARLAFSLNGRSFGELSDFFVGIQCRFQLSIIDHPEQIVKMEHHPRGDHATI
jgi:hypothetical protein